MYVAGSKKKHMVVIFSLKGQFTDFTWMVQENLSSLRLRVTYSVFNSFDPCDRYGRFNSSVLHGPLMPLPLLVDRFEPRSYTITLL